MIPVQALCTTFQVLHIHKSSVTCYNPKPNTARMRWKIWFFHPCVVLSMTSLFPYRSSLGTPFWRSLSTVTPSCTSSNVMVTYRACLHVPSAQVVVRSHRSCECNCRGHQVSRMLTGKIHAESVMITIFNACCMHIMPTGA